MVTRTRETKADDAIAEQREEARRALDDLLHEMRWYFRVLMTTLLIGSGILAALIIVTK